jgi:nucleoside-diphosphate-sugar epimerase
LLPTGFLRPATRHRRNPAGVRDFAATQAYRSNTDDPRQRRPDLARARALLGWEPRVALEEGLVKTIDYFRGRLGL